MSGECAAAGGRVRRPQRRPTCGVTPFRASLTGVLEVLQTDAAWAVSKVGECLGVVSRLVGLDLDQRWPQETVAMPRVNAVKSDFSKSLGPRERHG